MNAASSAVALQRVRIGGADFQDPSQSLPGLCCPLLLFGNALCSSSLSCPNSNRQKMYQAPSLLNLLSLSKIRTHPEGHRPV